MTVPCFGKHWDENVPQCKGGADPAYVSPEGSSIRQRCPLFTQCAAATATNQLKRMSVRTEEVKREHVSVTQGAQPTEANLAPRQPAPPAPAPQSQAMAPPQHPTMSMMTPHPMQGYISPHMAPYVQAPGMGMPGYLSVPEPRVPGQHWGWELFFNVLRSVIKGAAHTTGCYFDHTAIGYIPDADSKKRQG